MCPFYLKLWIHTNTFHIIFLWNICWMLDTIFYNINTECQFHCIKDTILNIQKTLFYGTNSSHCNVYHKIMWNFCLCYLVDSDNKTQSRGHTKVKPFIKIRKVTPPNSRKPSSIDLIIDNDDIWKEKYGIFKVTRDSYQQKSSFFSCSDSEYDDKQEMIMFATKIDSIAMRKKAKIQKRIEIGKED